ncbi:MAG: DNA adenine methylase [Alphaproteobacteria bacterium]
MLGFPVKKLDEQDIAKPVLKWAGGKGSLLPQISDKLPNKLRAGAISRYIEPFIGGGAVFFDIYNNYHIKEAFLFDINPELVILYNVIKKDVEKLINELAKLQADYQDSDNQKDFYYNIREEYNQFDKEINTIFYHVSFIRRAALTVFLNRTCFNGLFRVNSKGLFNVPQGSYKNPRILDEDNLRAVSKALQIATIQQADFAKTLNYVNQDTFIYYDPPYRPLNASSSFNAYAVGDFNDDEQRRLQEIFDKADKMGALQMLSNSDPTNVAEDPFFDDLYKDYNINRIYAKRMINSKSNGRGAIRELLITNYPV